MFFAHWHLPPAIDMLLFMIECTQPNHWTFSTATWPTMTLAGRLTNRL
jgi:hypothetical protein